MMNDQELGQVVDELITQHGSVSAAELTPMLRQRGVLPCMWTVIDVADFLREWYGNAVQ
jgi:hypothetical protein